MSSNAKSLRPHREGWGRRYVELSSPITALPPIALSIVGGAGEQAGFLEDLYLGVQGEVNPAKALGWEVPPVHIPVALASARAADGWTLEEDERKF